MTDNPTHKPLTTEWMETASGRMFYPLQPRIEQFCLEDLLIGCARLCRYAGQIKFQLDHYSVAEHSVLMTRWLMDNGYTDQKLLRTALMHDGQEGLIGDMIRPMKKCIPQFGKVEDHLCRLLAQKYDLSYPLPLIVKELDNRILVDERAQVMSKSGNHWGAIDDLVPLGVKIKCWSPSRAYGEMLDMAHSLGLGHVD